MKLHRQIVFGLFNLLILATTASAQTAWTGFEKMYYINPAGFVNQIENELGPGSGVNPEDVLIPAVRAWHALDGNWWRTEFAGYSNDTACRSDGAMAMWKSVRTYFSDPKVIGTFQRCAPWFNVSSSVVTYYRPPSGDPSIALYAHLAKHEVGHQRIDASYGGDASRMGNMTDVSCVMGTSIDSAGVFASTGQVAGCPAETALIRDQGDVNRQYSLVTREAKIALGTYTQVPANNQPTVISFKGAMLGVQSALQPAYSGFRQTAGSSGAQSEAYLVNSLTGVENTVTGSLNALNPAAVVFNPIHQVWYAAVNTGSGPSSTTNGTIKVYRSANGATWTEIASLAQTMNGNGRIQLVLGAKGELVLAQSLTNASIMIYSSGELLAGMPDEPLNWRVKAAPPTGNISMFQIGRVLSAGGSLLQLVSSQYWTMHCRDSGLFDPTGAPYMDPTLPDVFSVGCTLYYSSFGKLKRLVFDIKPPRWQTGGPNIINGVQVWDLATYFLQDEGVKTHGEIAFAYDCRAGQSCIQEGVLATVDEVGHLIWRPDSMSNPSLNTWRAMQGGSGLQRVVAGPFATYGDNDITGGKKFRIMYVER